MPEPRSNPSGLPEEREGEEQCGVLQLGWLPSVAELGVRQR